MMSSLLCKEKMYTIYEYKKEMYSFMITDNKLFEEFK